MIKILKIFILFLMLVWSNSVFSNELEYDYSDTYSIPIRLSPLKEISTKEPYNPGQKVEFEVLYNVYDNGKIIVKSGDIVNAEVELCISSGMNGFPAEIIIDNFDIPGIKKSQLAGTYTKTGQNRCLIVYPIKWLLTPIPLAGSLTNFIKGGQATLNAADEVEIYYYPNWK